MTSTMAKSSGDSHLRLAFFSKIALGKWRAASELAKQGAQMGQDVASWRSMRGQPAVHAAVERWASQPPMTQEKLAEALAMVEGIGAKIDDVDDQGRSAQQWLWDRARALCGPAHSGSGLDIAAAGGGMSCQKALKIAFQSAPSNHQGAVGLNALLNGLRQGVFFALALERSGAPPELADARFGLAQCALMLCALEDSLGEEAFALARRQLRSGWDGDSVGQAPLALRVCMEHGGERARVVAESLGLGAATALAPSNPGANRL